MGRTKDFNDYIIDGQTTKIIFVNKKRDRFEILIDTEDLQKLIDLNYSWSASWREKTQSYYAVASVYQGDGKNNKTIYLHRIIMDATKGDFVDHKDSGNTLDNRKINLRKTINKHNLQNRNGANKNSTSGVRNVHLVNRYGDKQVYLVQIMKDYQRYVWEFGIDEFEEACNFAEKKRQELFGKFAGRGKTICYN